MPNAQQLHRLANAIEIAEAIEAWRGYAANNVTVTVRVNYASGCAGFDVTMAALGQIVAERLEDLYLEALDRAKCEVDALQLEYGIRFREDLPEAAPPAEKPVLEIEKPPSEIDDDPIF